MLYDVEQVIDYAARHMGVLMHRLALGALWHQTHPTVE